MYNFSPPDPPFRCSPWKAIVRPLRDYLFLGIARVGLKSYICIR